MSSISSMRQAPTGLPNRARKHVGLRCRGRQCCASALAKGEMFKIDSDVYGKTFAVCPGMTEPANDRLILVTAVRREHSAWLRGQSGHRVPIRLQ